MPLRLANPAAMEAPASAGASDYVRAFFGWVYRLPTCFSTVLMRSAEEPTRVPGPVATHGWRAECWSYPSRVPRHIVLASSLALAAGLAGCNPGQMLELEVMNDSGSEAIVEILGPDGADTGFREVARPWGGFKVAVERPGPGGWAVTIDGQLATDWTMWPDDNPVIDLTLWIHPDGSVEVQDT